MTLYITIRSDGQYSQSTASTSLIAYMASITELRQTGPMTFSNSAGSPWVSIILAQASSHGNYSIDGEFYPDVNVVELICSDHESAKWYEYLATKIASFLGWSVFEDHEQPLVK